MTEKIYLRCSKVGLLLNCASSHCKTENPYTPKYDAATIGTATHEGLHQFGIDNFVDFIAIAKKYNLKVEDFKSLVFAGISYIDEQDIDLSEAGFELRYNVNLTDKIVISGTIDLITHNENYYHVTDWKSGEERQAKDQLMSYLLMIYKLQHILPAYYGTEVYLRHDEQETYKWTADDLEIHAQNIIDATKKIGKEYNPGEHCRFCPRQLECNVKSDYAKSSVTALTGVETKEITNETLGRLIPKAKELEEVLGRFKKLIKERGKVQPLQDETGQLYKTVKGTKDVINKEIALRVMGDYFDEDDIDDFTVVNKTKIKEWVKKKGLKMKEIIEDIRKEGGITKTETHTFRKVKQ